MDLGRLGGMVAQAQEEKGITNYLLEHEIGAPNGKAFNAAQLDRLKRGARKLPVPPEVVWRLIRILDLDPIETAEAAGVWPPGVTADMLRQLDLAAVGASDDNGTVTAPYPEGPARSVVVPFDRRNRRDRRRPRPEQVAA